MAGILTVCAAHLEYKELAATRRVEREILGRSGETEGGIADAHIDLGIGDHAGPATDARQNHDVLLSVRAAIRDRLTDESRPRAELPEQMAVLRVHRFEQPIHGAVER